MKLLAKFKKIEYMEFRGTLNFWNLFLKKKKSFGSSIKIKVNDIYVLVSIGSDSPKKK